MMVLIALSASSLQITKIASGFTIDIETNLSVWSQAGTFETLVSDNVDNRSVSLAIATIKVPHKPRRTVLEFTLTNIGSDRVSANLLVYGQFEHPNAKGDLHRFFLTDSGVHISVPSMPGHGLAFNFRADASGWYYGPPISKSLLLSPPNTEQDVMVQGSLGWSYLNISLPPGGSKTFPVIVLYDYCPPYDYYCSTPTRSELERSTSFVTPMLIYFGICITLMAPNLIIFLVTSFCSQRCPAPILSLMFSLAINCTYGLLVMILLTPIGFMGEFTWFDRQAAKIFLYIAIGGNALAPIIGFWIPKGNCTVIRQLTSTVAASDEGRAAIAENFALPCEVKLNATSGHEESREVQDEYESYWEDIYEYRTDNYGNSYRVRTGSVQRWRYYTTHYSEWARVDAGGGRLGHVYCGYGRRLDPKYTETKFVTVWTDCWYLTYGSWQEGGQMPEFPDVNVAHVLSTYICNIDPSAVAEVERNRQRLHTEGKKHDTVVSVKESRIVVGFVHDLSVSLNDELVIPIREFYAKWYGKMLWGICLIIGYQASFECFCNLGYDTKAGDNDVNIQCVKWVNLGPGLNVPYGRRDEQARAVAMEQFGRGKLED
jgi:hypothetical protein